jgi:hypothetical protein
MRPPPMTGDPVIESDAGYPGEVHLPRSAVLPMYPLDCVQLDGLGDGRTRCRRCQEPSAGRPKAAGCSQRAMAATAWELRGLGVTSS